MQPSERGAPGPKPARRRAEAARPGSRQWPGRPRWRRLPRVPLLLAGEEGIPAPPPPRPAPALAPRFFVLGKRIPEGGCASSFTRPLQFWDGRIFVWSAEQAPLVCFFLRLTGTHECAGCPAGEAGSRYGGLQSCPGALRAPRQQRKGDPTGAAGTRTVPRT